MNRIRGRSAALSAVATLVVTGSLWGIPGAWAATCAAPARYTAIDNTLYLTGGTATLSRLKAACPAAPLHESAPGSGIWELDSDLVVQNGARLTLHGKSQGGDVDQLRLRSPSSTSKTDVSSVSALHGTLDLLGVKVTSWNPASGGPDTDASVPSGAPVGSRGRAFIRALSFVDAQGQLRVSRMDIRNSDLGYLGFFGAESYGVAYKARGCGIATQSVCARLGVLGSEVNSIFHHNYMGTYTWGAHAIRFTRNEYHHNIAYGLDPHDDSDHLLIDRNSSHDNGNHGIICSQRCDHLTITNNTVYANGVVPYVPPTNTDPTSKQVHGIMIHKGVTDTLIAGNNVHDQPNGAGIAVFDSSRDVIRGNNLARNKYGLRITTGSRNLTVTRNTISATGTHAIYAFKGVNPATYTNRNGRSSDIVFSANTIVGSGGAVVNVVDTDRFTFVGNAFRGTLGGNIGMVRSLELRWRGNSLPSTVPFVLTGDQSSGSSAGFLELARPVSVSLDAFSKAIVHNSDGRLAQAGSGPSWSINGRGSTLVLNRDSGAAAAAGVLLTPQPVRLMPASAVLIATTSSWSRRGGQFTVRAATAKQVVHVYLAPLARATRITATDASGRTVARGTADGKGGYRFNIIPGTTASRTFTVHLS